MRVSLQEQSWIALEYIYSDVLETRQAVSVYFEWSVTVSVIQSIVVIINLSDKVCVIHGSVE